MQGLKRVAQIGAGAAALSAASYAALRVYTASNDGDLEAELLEGATPGVPMDVRTLLTHSRDTGPDEWNLAVCSRQCEPDSVTTCTLLLRRLLLLLLTRLALPLLLRLSCKHCPHATCAPIITS